MKRILFFLSVSLLSVANSVAQTQPVAIKNVRVFPRAGQVEVYFDVVTAPSAVKSNEAIVFTPVLIRGDYRLPLQSVQVAGRSAAISLERQLMSQRVDFIAGSEEVIQVKNGQTYYYYNAVNYKEWMEGSRLVLESKRFVCRKVINEQRVIADNLIISPQPETYPNEIGPELQTTPQSTLPTAEFHCDQAERDEQ